MNQLAIEFEPQRLARKRDPQTSHDAAARVDTFKASHEAAVFAAICDAGERGATYREIAIAARMEPVAVARRLAGMEARFLIERRLKPGTTLPNDYQERGRCAVWWKST